MGKSQRRVGAWWVLLALLAIGLAWHFSSFTLPKAPSSPEKLQGAATLGARHFDEPNVPSRPFLSTPNLPFGSTIGKDDYKLSDTATRSLLKCLPDLQRVARSLSLESAWAMLQSHAGGIESKQLEFENLHFRQKDGSVRRLNIEVIPSPHALPTRTQLKLLSEDAEGYPQIEALPLAWKALSLPEILDHAKLDGELMFHEFSVQVFLADGSRWRLFTNAGQIQALAPLTPSSSLNGLLLCERDVQAKTLECLCRK